MSFGEFVEMLWRGVTRFLVITSLTLVAACAKREANFWGGVATEYGKRHGHGS